ncbi:MAG: hypothetical protein JO205_10630 [Pseudolabrys sp.]|nr:hypothetical protein [Pseudolabrys sp.]
MSDEYRAQSARFRAEANQEQDPVRRSDLAWLATSYLRLAEQADANEANNIVYETRQDVAGLTLRQA